MGEDLGAESGDPRAHLAKEGGIRSHVALPIVDGAVFVGVLELFGPKHEAPNPKLVDALREIGHQLGAYAVRKRAEASLHEAKEAAEAASRAKSEFLATMSHEIRTPMNGVLGFAQLLQQSPLTSQQADFVASIRSSAESLLNVINDVLDFSKIESGYMTIERAPFSLELCLEEAIETVAMAAGEKGLDLAARVDPAVPAGVIGDALRVRQVLVNLLGNAVKFTSHGEISLEATRAIRVWESDAGARPARIVALTANVLSGDRENCLRAGMDDYLPKPLRLDALRSFLQAVCDGRDAPTHESPVPPPPSSTVHDVLRDLVADVSLDEAVLLAKDYVGSLGDQLASLRRAIASGDLVVGARLAHSLKGSAAIFGLDATKACAAKVEAACRDGRSDEATSATSALEAASRDDAHELDVALAALSDSVARMS